MSHTEHGNWRGQPIAYGIGADDRGAEVLVRPGWKTVSILFAAAAVLTSIGAFLASIVDEVNRGRDDG